MRFTISLHNSHPQGVHLNTLEKFHIYKENKTGQLLNEVHTDQYKPLFELLIWVQWEGWTMVWLNVWHKIRRSVYKDPRPNTGWNKRIPVYVAWEVGVRALNYVDDNLHKIGGRDLSCSSDPSVLGFKTCYRSIQHIFLFWIVYVFDYGCINFHPQCCVYSCLWFI
jgi:hypothetical protein